MRRKYQFGAEPILGAGGVRSTWLLRAMTLVTS